MYSSIPKGMTDLTLAIEKATNAVLTNKYNPFYYHGALPQFYLWVLFLSGLLLFAYYIPTIDNAYFSENLVNAWTSVDYITDTLPFGAVVRGIHRYAGDAMVITIVLHALRVWITDRYRQYRWTQWVTGIVLLLMVLFIGQTGYYLVWDERSLVLTRMTSSALEALPFVGPGLKAWFLNGAAITNLTLSNFLFIHIGLSFSLLFGLWLHYVRMTRPVITPPPAINYILTAVLLVFVFILPITSGKMADINAQPTSFEIDWFFLWPYSILASWGTSAFWFVLIGGSVALCLVPFPSLYKAAHPVEAAEVVLNKCTGCSFCSKDCPYQAIEMVPAPAGSRFKLLATVKAYRCSGCGVCVGACAFDAIDLPNLLDTDVTAKIKALAETK
ncbi:MAG TPA: cytochrome b N-terminal domain-containing protein [Candidatus Obscuribacter sp.]|nr:cytochrome b N-terminal domain-containing protein [Candidatus Obscuribacter sp.]HNA72857.1 cytochrome b N-terminal domain-containing protein [Candidatus Obscuribacter sp.]HNG75580.1 cytochrome b N-terminal domain-containing protein [Candidatus Obscuribacter sp.]HNH75154.1 cytochrome b N-terminal domain-containing protein [Candidatus Obscuribacter sp.]HNM49964.1 cytochrome b N-terminal domain-containing protein [Candidatus Obscuribacter sp.]